MSNMSDLVNILRSIPGYILNPAETYEKNRNESYSYAVAIFVILYAAIFLLSGFLVVIYNILSWGSGDPVFLFLLLFIWFGSYGLLCLVEIPIILVVIHFASKFGNKSAGFVDSFKITFIGCAFFIFIIGFIVLINVILIIVCENYNSDSLEYLIQYPLYILATLCFIRVSAEGIRTLHGLSKLKSYAIAVISILAAYFVMCFVWFQIVGIFLV